MSVHKRKSHLVNHISVRIIRYIAAIMAGKCLINLWPISSPIEPDSAVLNTAAELPRAPGIGEYNDPYNNDLHIQVMDSKYGL